MHARSDNVEIIRVVKQMRLLKNFLNLFCKDIKTKLEESMRGSEFTFDGVNALYYDLNKVSLSRGKSIY